MVISVQLLNFFTRKKIELLVNTLYTSFLSSSLYWNAESSVQYFSVYYNLEGEKGGRGGAEELHAD